MAFCDFVVRYDPEKDSPEDLTKKILYSLFISRIKNKKPVVSFIGGDSGEGKSLGLLRLFELLFEIQGLNLIDFINDVNVYIPIEYPEKLDALLFDKELKKANMIGIHEAREVIKAKNWHSFINQAIADVNAMSRSIKRLMVFIIAQFIKDIDSSVRYTLNYYMIVRRPKGKKARLYINIMWKDDRDLEKPKLRKRKMSGYLVYPNGRYRRYVPQYLELSKPNKAIIDIFEKQDREAKAMILRNKLDKLVKEMKAEIGADSNKLSTMVEFYTKNVDSLNMIGKRFKSGFRIKPNFREMHDLSKAEVVQFEKMLNDKLKDKGIIQENNKDENDT